VGNKIMNDIHSEFIKKELKDIPLLGMISYNKKLIDSDLQGIAAYNDNDLLLSEVREIIAKLKECVK
jgi:CO dehydrogenase nickel-insertion accessory protein CooC1